MITQNQLHSRSQTISWIIRNKNTYRQRIHVAHKTHTTQSSLHAIPTPALTNPHSSHVPYATGTGYLNISYNNNNDKKGLTPSKTNKTSI